MSRSDQRFLNSAIRSDFSTFMHRCFKTLNPGAVYRPNWHIDAIAHQLERIQSGEITRLIINLPPRYLKSLMVSVAFPAFLLGHNPRLKIFGISYGADLASKHAADFKAVVSSPWYQAAFPNMSIERVLDADVYTSKRGFRKSTSVYAALTGLGGDAIILDDPQKPVDAQSETHRNNLTQWYANTLISRLDDKQKGIVIVVMQRVHLNDLTGYLIERSDDWSVLSLPAIAEVDDAVSVGPRRVYRRQAGEALHPSYESLITLEKMRVDMGSEVFSAQYQQVPVPPGGAMIRREWLRYYDVLPERTYSTKVIQSWDTAAKDGAQNDWSVCTTWFVHDKRFYLLDVTRGRFEYPRLRETAIALADRYQPNRILIEDASTGIALAQELRASGTYPVRPITVERDKVGRLYVQQAKFEAGLVLFPKGARFLAELEAELLTFPQGRTDDIVDSISQALAFKNSGYDETLSWV